MPTKFLRAIVVENDQFIELFSDKLTKSTIFPTGDPNMVGRDGSVPLMVCLVPLINKDPLHHFTHSMKVLPFFVINAPHQP